MNKIVKIILIIVAVLVAAFFGLKAFTKSNSPEQTAKYDQNGLTAQVDYCSPSMKGRKIFGELLPFGQVWRTGANEATIFEVKQDVKIGDKALKAGKYTLWTIPNANNWTIVINSETGQWGTSHDEKADILKVDVPADKTIIPIESLTINFVQAEGGADMVIAWENTEVKVPVRL